MYIQMASICSTSNSNQKNVRERKRGRESSCGHARAQEIERIFLNTDVEQMLHHIAVRKEVGKLDE